VKEIVVNVEREETRVGILEDGVLAELYIERVGSQRLVGNIYKGIVENVLPGMQAAFVDIGLEKNAFLYVGDIIYEDEKISTKNIRDVLKVGQEIIVQVVKEPIGTKGARVTTQLTLPGRYLVLMPTVDYVGVSRRIESESERERLREIAENIKPKNKGLIVRTVAEGKNESDFKSDINFLTKLWERLQGRMRNVVAPSLLHRDLGLVCRIIRDLMTEEVSKMLIDNQEEYEKATELLEYASPHLKNRVKLYRGETDIFDKYGIEPEIDKILKRKVWLKCGGYIVIDQTEALTAIDVNTGKYVGSTNLADTVLKTNIDAANEIAKQIRLRNIGGIIIVDFIDMESESDRQRVINTLEEAVKKDKVKTNVLGLTKLGLVEITRKKVGNNLLAVLEQECPYCQGTGKVLSQESVLFKLRKELLEIGRRVSGEAILVEVYPSVASLLIGAGGSHLAEIEKEIGKSVYVKGRKEFHIEEFRVRSVATREEAEKYALPVSEGDELSILVEEAHATSWNDGIGRIEGYVINIEDGAKKVGEKVKVRITKASKTSAKAELL
jgi:ribonuclease G